MDITLQYDMALVNELLLSDEADEATEGIPEGYAPFDTGNAPAIPERRNLREMTRDDWEKHRGWLVSYATERRFPVHQLRELLHSKGYRVTDAMITKKLRFWNISLQQKPEEKEQRCRELLYASQNGLPLPAMDPNEIRRIDRYCDTRLSESPDYRTVQDIVRAMRSAEYKSRAGPSSETERVRPGHQRPSHRVDHSDASSSSMFSTDESSNLATLQDPPNPSDIAPRAAIRDPELAVRKLRRQGGKCFMMMLRQRSSEATDTWRAIDGHFWRALKNSIYFFKMRDEKLAKMELASAQALIPQVCRSCSLTFIQNIFTVLLPALSIDERFMTAIIVPIGVFVDKQKATTFSNGLLQVLCVLGLSGMILDPAFSIAFAQEMLQEAQRELAPDDQRLSDLTRNLIRMCRRQKDFATAERLSTEFIKRNKQLYGDDALNTRIAMTERVHILEDQGQLHAALKLACDILESARRELKEHYPDDKALYSMEDAAQLYRKLGKYDDSINKLMAASAGRRKLEGQSSALEHIQDKLQSTWAMKME